MGKRSLRCGVTITSVPLCFRIFGFHQTANIEGEAASFLVCTKCPFTARAITSAESPRSLKGTPVLSGLSPFSPWHRAHRARKSSFPFARRRTRSAAESGESDCSWRALRACIAVPPAKPARATLKRRVAVLPAMAALHSTSIRRIFGFSLHVSA